MSEERSGAAVRRERALELARQQGADSLLTVDRTIVTWLTGYAPPFGELPNPFTPPPVAIVRPDGGATLIVDERSSEWAQCFDCELRTYVGYALEPSLDALKRWQAAVSEAARGFRPVAERASTPACLAAIVDLADLASKLSRLRERKDDDEIQLLRRAISVCDVGQAAARAAAIEGASELEVWAAIRKAVDAAAGEPVLLFGTVASGPRSACGNGPPTGRTLHDGDLVLVDLAPCVGGYWGDSCATFAVGSCDSEVQAAHWRVLDVLEETLRRLAPGEDIAAIDRAARERLSFRHHLGHGIGVSFHEQPRIVPSADGVLREGMVLAVEPGFYTPNWGIRLERAALVTGIGCEVLGQHELSLTAAQIPLGDDATIGHRSVLGEQSSRLACNRPL